MARGRGGMPGGPGGPGGMDMGAMMKQVQKMQADMLKAQEELKDVVVDASAGGGMIKVTMSGDLELRSVEIDANVSAISALTMMRSALLPVQRAFARDRRVVMVGRDIGSVVFPHAAVKIYLDASLAERARRRWAELVETDPSVSQADVEADLRRRDRIDSNRGTAPLQVAEGAMVVTTDGKSIDLVVDEVAAIAERVWSTA